MNPQIEEVIFQLEELKEEFTKKSKLQEKADKVISILKKNPELAIEKALTELEEFCSPNLLSYHRTQVWSIISLLESLKK